jgi:hypothetical protein
VKYYQVMGHVNRNSFPIEHCSQETYNVIKPGTRYCSIPVFKIYCPI